MVQNSYLQDEMMSFGADNKGSTDKISVFHREIN